MLMINDLPKSRPTLLADRDRLAQILRNLLSNAHKHSPSHTRIHISVEEVGAKRTTATSCDLITRRARLLAISVQDEGPGIEGEDQEKLFSKFHRVDNSRTREIEGTGLGLAITESFVEMHGGRVWVESRLDMSIGRGSRFTVTIPVADQSAIAKGS
jgi:signal transduction histidine kinase